MQNQGLNRIYIKNNHLVPKSVRATKNRSHSWQPGYNKKYDIVIVSKDGTIGDIYTVSGLNIALPSTPKLTSTLKKENQVKVEGGQQ